MKARTRCKWLAVITVLCIVFTALIPTASVCAEITTVHQVFEGNDWEFPYSDDFFRASAEQYNHDFAKLTLGLALASYRDAENPDAQDDTLLKFFGDIGFTQPQTEIYHTEPTSFSICCGLAQKKIGDMTVVACGVCGGNYGSEWASNLTIGDSERAEGFNDSSRKVQEIIGKYLEDNGLNGKVALWITGFSRGGAVANITAADCTASGTFDAVYSYTFATPFTTKEPKDYPNIFNIIQKEDVVAKIPLADWGYRRYGKDLFIISPETDSDFAPVLNRASEIYREKTGSEMVTNSEINYQLRIVMDYLLTLVPDSATYTKYLQPLIVDILTEDDGTMNALEVLLEALERYSVENDAAGNELKALRDYLGTLLDYYCLRGSLKHLPAQMWNPKNGIGNLFNAHQANEYLSLLNATDDPNELYSDNLDYIRLIIYGKADQITISDGDTVLKEITADGKEWVDGEEEPYSYPDAACSDDKTVITLPADHSMQVRFRSGAFLPQTVTYTGLRFSGYTVRAKADNTYSYLMTKGQTLTIKTAMNGKSIESEGSDHTDISLFIEPFYSPTTAMRLETNAVVHLTISGLVNRLLLVLVILLVQMLVSIALGIVRKVKHRKRNQIVALIWHFLIAGLFAVFEVAMWYFIPILPIAKIIPGVLTGLVIAIFAWKGCFSFSRNWKWFWILMLLLTAFTVVNILVIGEFTVWKAIILLIAYTGFMAASYTILWLGKSRQTKNAPKADASAAAAV